MKKIISILALTILITACKKTQLPVQTNQEVASVSYQKSGGSSYPTVTTTAATTITSATATSGGNVSSSGGGNQVTERGICYNTSPNPRITNNKVLSGSGPGDFVSILSGLAGNTTYYVRAYAIYKGTTIYGNQVVFTTLQNYGTVTDFDGNVYNTIQIGSQIWMVENLKTTHYRDGTPIPNVTDITAWAALSTGAYCNYNNDESNAATYGRLYNWYTVSDAHNLAPAGWHVPSYTEWYTTFMNNLGGCSVAGRKLKDNVLWDGDNSSGFKGLPAGYRSPSGVFASINSQARWRLSTVSLSNPESAWYVEQDSGDGSCGISGWYNPKYGYSIRLVKD